MVNNRRNHVRRNLDNGAEKEVEINAAAQFDRVERDAVVDDGVDEPNVHLHQGSVAEHGEFEDFANFLRHFGECALVAVVVRLFVLSQVFEVEVGREFAFVPSGGLLEHNQRFVVFAVRDQPARGFGVDAVSLVLDRGLVWRKLDC